MKIVPSFSRSDIEKMLAKKKELFVKAIIRRFQFIGEAFIADARSVDSYTDQSGNLRSSIGYVILQDGVQLGEAFPGSHTDGVAQGKKIATEVAKNYPKGIVLICVAGMEYAWAVETGYRGERKDGEPMFVTPYDVISGSSIKAETNLQKTLEQLSKRIK